MEEIFIKKGRKYISIGLTYENEWLRNGLWLVDSNPGSKSITSLFWLVGETKNLTNVIDQASLIKHAPEITKYVGQLGDENSAEYKEAKQIYGDYLQGGGIRLVNASRMDFVNLIFRKLSMLIEEEKRKQIEISKNK